MKNKVRDGVKNSDVAFNIDNWYMVLVISYVDKIWGEGGRFFGKVVCFERLKRLCVVKGYREV